MPTTLPHHQAKSGPSRSRSGSGIALPVTMLLPPLALAALSFILPAALLLPATSVLCLTCGFVLAAGVWVKRHLTGHAGEGDYDIPGGLVFFGFAASILTDAPDAIRWLEDLARAYQPQGAGMAVPTPPR